MTTGNFLIPKGIYDKVVSILENPRVSDTSGQNFSRSARVFVIPVEHTRGYTRGPGIPAQHWLGRGAHRAPRLATQVEEADVKSSAQ